MCRPEARLFRIRSARPMNQARWVPNGLLMHIQSGARGIRHSHRFLLAAAALEDAGIKRISLAHSPKTTGGNHPLCPTASKSYSSAGCKAPMSRPTFFRSRGCMTPKIPHRHLFHAPLCRARHAYSSRLPVSVAHDRRPDESGRGAQECARHVAFRRLPAGGHQEPRLGKVEAIQVHHLVPCSHEILHKRLLRVVGCVDFRDCPELRV